MSVVTGMSSAAGERLQNTAGRDDISTITDDFFCQRLKTCFFQTFLTYLII